MAEPIQTKRCSKCKQFKPISEYRIKSGRKDGHRSECKVCGKKYDKIYSQTKNFKDAQKRYHQSEKGKDAFRRGSKKYRESEKGKANRKRYRQSEEGKVSQKAAEKRFYVLHPNFLKAKSAVNNAIQAGLLPRASTLSCYYCPAQAKEYHHWHGCEPEHWLNVIPVCKKCHALQSRKAS